jgi:hypothetical protein
MEDQYKDDDGKWMTYNKAKVPQGRTYCDEYFVGQSGRGDEEMLDKSWILRNVGKLFIKSLRRKDGHFIPVSVGAKDDPEERQ